MYIYQLLFAYFVLIFIWITIIIIHTKFLLLFIIANINRLFLHFIITLESNKIGSEGTKALAEVLKLNKNLITLNLSKFLRLFLRIFTVIKS